MTTVDKSQINTMISLEAIESERRIIIQALEKVNQQYNGLDAQLEKVSMAVNDSEAHLLELKKAYRQAESDLQDSQSKIEASREKLRSVKDNKEYTAVLKEIDDMKRAASKTEDQMLADLEAIDGVESEVATKKEAYNQQQQQIEAQKAEISTQETANRDRLAVLDQQFEKVAQKIDQQLMKAYNMVKSKQNSGATVVAVKDAVCNGCHLNIPPQMYNELQRCDSLQFCPHCQRIIYWGGLVEAEHKA